jgi:prepilin-type N-terminal cleavage/methylation domain-containing protein
MASPRTLKGFSLLEMLVAITVLSMVIGLSTYAYAMFTRQWEGHLGRFDEAQAQYQRYEWLAAALEDTLPYMVRDDNGAAGFYFLGRDEGLTLVTMSPIFGVGEPALIRVFREADDGNAWRLVYEEAPFAGTLLAHPDQRMEFRHRLVIARGLPLPAFRYFGWSNLQSSLSDGGPLSAERAWFGEYDGLQRHYHPEKIELRIGNGATVFSVPARVESLVSSYGDSE